MAGRRTVVSGARSEKTNLLDRADFGHDPIESGTVRSIGEDRTMVLKHAGSRCRVSLGHARVSGNIEDFGILTRMLYVAFLAEQGVALCNLADPAFASETRADGIHARLRAAHQGGGHRWPKRN
jgi:hypothetical protein